MPILPYLYFPISGITSVKFSAKFQDSFPVTLLEAS